MLRPLTLVSLIAALAATAPAAAQTFTQRWAASGFSDREANQGVALGDQNGDGAPDVFLTSVFVENPIPFLPDLGGPDQLYRNGGTGSFTDVAPALGVDDLGWGQGAAWSDYDNDGLLDLYVVRGLQEAVAQSHLLYRQTPTGFDPAPSASVGLSGAGRSVCWADYDNDGLLDIFVTNGLDSGAFLPDARVRLFHNRGGDVFEDVSIEMGIDDLRNGHACAWADHDNDGDLDLFVANHGFEDPILGLSDPQANALYQNMRVETGTATFVDVADAAGVTGLDAGLPGGPGGSASFGACWGDLDNDGWLDLFVTNGFSGIIPFPTPNRFYRNNHDGTFQDRTLAVIDLDFDESSFGCTVGDFDNDGDLDVFVANSHVPLVAEATNDLLVNSGWPLHLLTNQESSAGVGVAEFATACASADLTGDGWLDIYSVNSPPGVELLFEVEDDLFVNDGGSNHWLHLDLVGRASNRSAVGARVILDDGVRTQIREVAAGSGYQSMDDLRVEFGLGNRLAVASVTVRWPSGCVQVIEGVAVDQVLEIVEECASTPNDILRGEWSLPLAPVFPLRWYAAAPAGGVWQDPEAVVGDGRLLYYQHDDPAAVLRVSRAGATVELDWR